MEIRIGTAKVGLFLLAYCHMFMLTVLSIWKYEGILSIIVAGAINVFILWFILTLNTELNKIRSTSYYVIL